MKWLWLSWWDPGTAEAGKIGEGYILIAARRGWTPTMFMTRVRL
jgi:hypothetical protein